MPLSLPAELLLLSFDPATRRLYPVRRARLLLALAAADGAGRGGRWTLRRRGRGALRRALAELQERGIAEPGRAPLLADRAALARSYTRLADGMRAKAFADERDETLVLLLASTGALAQRLRGRDPRWFKRMVADLVPEENPRATVALPASVIGLALAADMAYDFDGGGEGGAEGGLDMGELAGGDSGP